MDAVELFKNAGYDVSLKIQHRVCLTCFLGLFLAQFRLVSLLVTSPFYEAEKCSVQVPSVSYAYKEFVWPVASLSQWVLCPYLGLLVYQCISEVLRLEESLGLSFCCTMLCFLADLLSQRPRFACEGRISDSPVCFQKPKSNWRQNFPVLEFMLVVRCVCTQHKGTFAAVL